MTMTKQDLVEIVMNNSDFNRAYDNRADVIKFVEDFFEVIIQGLESGDSVKIPSFGKFILRDKKSRMGRNPKTKEQYLIDARRVVSFRASSIFKTALKMESEQDAV